MDWLKLMAFFHVKDWSLTAYWHFRYYKALYTFYQEIIILYRISGSNYIDLQAYSESAAYMY
jgi:hypothetical protein